MPTKHITYLLTSLVFLIASIPLLKMGYSGDDVLNTLIRGMIFNTQTTFFEFTKKYILVWIHAGRLDPLALILSYGFCYLFGIHLVLYNFFHWVVVLLSYLLTCIFLQKLNFSNYCLLLFICLLPVCWSLSSGTPLVSFAILLPSVVIFIMLALINYQSFLATKQLKYCYYSAIFSLLAFLTYEISLLIIPAIFLLNKYHENKFLVKNKATYLIFAVAFLYLAAAFTIRHFFTTFYSGIAFGNLLDVPYTFLKQLVGSLPSTHFRYIKANQHLNWSTYTLALLLTVCSFSAVYQFLDKKYLKITQVKWIFFIGLLLQIVPALMLGASARYQTEITFGRPQISVFIQQIGFVIMLITIFYELINSPKLSRPRAQFLLKIILSLLISITTSFNFIANMSFSEYWNQQTRYPYEIYQQALQEKLFSQLPSHAIILRSSLHPLEEDWHNRDFFHLLLDRSDLLVYDFSHNLLLQGLDQNEKIAPNLSTQLAKNNVFYLDIKNAFCDGPCGYVILGQVTDKKGNFPNAEFKVKHVKIFYTAGSQEDLKKVLLNMANYLNPSSIAEIMTLITQQAKLSGLVSVPNNTPTIRY